MSKKKYLWLNNTVHEYPDPEWTEDKAVELGLIPARESISRVESTKRPDPRQEAILTSLGSLAFEERSFSLDK